MAKNSFNFGVIDLKAVAGLAGLACAIGFGFFAAVFQAANPLIAAGIGLFVGIGVGQVSAKGGVILLFVGIGAFLLALNP